MDVCMYVYAYTFSARFYIFTQDIVFNIKYGPKRKYYLMRIRDSRKKHNILVFLISSRMLAYARNGCVRLIYLLLPTPSVALS